ncbi:hypothetical protein TNCV_3023211 [Trichonephila clavipes]|uniref:DUF5641 domain-containing protein n=1 Tax=Trichonephila clavipes TaxID=2585209 RepID=A0A8X6RZN0_TRICX|nr:hypothetical protein TNCV_3023211 [Trichonephila clavipes]
MGALLHACFEGSQENPRSRCSTEPFSGRTLRSPIGSKVQAIDGNPLLRTGNLSLIKDENLPSTKWSTGRITEIFLAPMFHIKARAKSYCHCMVLKANDRRTSCPCHDEFPGPRSDYV